MGIWTITLFLMALLVVFGFLMRQSSTGARVLRDGSVTGIIGRKGHGKSLFTVHEILRQIGQPSYCRECSEALGRRVVHRATVASNSALRLSDELTPFFRYVESWDDLLSLPHATLVVIDEAHLWAPAKQGEQLPEHVRFILAQCRKLHIEILWVSQREDRVTLGLRAQTDEIGMCKKGFMRQMSVRFVEPEDIQKLRMRAVKPLWVFRYRVTKRLAAAYNTFELILPQESAVSSTDLRQLSLDRRAAAAAFVEQHRLIGPGATPPQAKRGGVARPGSTSSGIASEKLEGPGLCDPDPSYRPEMNPPDANKVT